MAVANEMQQIENSIPGLRPARRTPSEWDVVKKERDERDWSTRCTAEPSLNSNVSPSPTRDAEPDVHDSEALECTPSGPPHSVFSKRQKQYIVFLAAWGGFFSPLSSNIYFPALNALAQDLKVSSGVINLTLTSYVIFQGLAPTIFGGESFWSVSSLSKSIFDPKDTFRALLAQDICFAAPRYT